LWKAFPLYGGGRPSLCSTESVEYPATLMFNHVLSIAAFGFIAFVLVFMHPASHAAREAAQQTARQEAADRMPPHLAASR
jgi:hypothetical protein